MWKRSALGGLLVAIVAWQVSIEKIGSTAAPDKLVISEQKENPRPMPDSPFISMGAIASPFSRGSPPALPPLETRIAERRETMRKLGISTPDSYFRMGLHELKSRGETGDVFALLQLGVQYSTEHDYLERDDDFNFSTDLNLDGRGFFSKAVEAGHNHSAAILAKSYADEGDLINAYAWNILAKRLWDNSGDAWVGTRFSTMRQEDIQLAQQRAEQFYAMAIARFRQR